MIPENTPSDRLSSTLSVLLREPCYTKCYTLRCQNRCINDFAPVICINAKSPRKPRLCTWLSGACQVIKMVNGAGLEPATTGLKVRCDSELNPINTRVSGPDETHPLPKPLPGNAKTSQDDGIRAALAGLSRNELIALLADALATPTGEGPDS